MQDFSEFLMNNGSFQEGLKYAQCPNQPDPQTLFSGASHEKNDLEQREMLL